MVAHRESGFVGARAAAELFVASFERVQTRRNELKLTLFHAEFKTAIANDAALNRDLIRTIGVQLE